jgi:hypothetical protein
MTDDPDLPPPTAAEQRAALRHIVHYRQLRRGIRKAGTGTLGWGLVMLFIWYAAFYQTGQMFTPLAMIHLAIAVGEVAVGLWKKLFPVPEAYILDGLVLFGFAAANLYRLAFPPPRDATPRGLLIGLAVWMGLAAVGRLASYNRLRKADFRRPSGEQMRWFDELVADTRAANPEADPHSLDLPTEPPVRMKLLGDTALVMTPGDDDPAVYARESIDLRRVAHPDPTKPPYVELTIDGDDAGSFRLTDTQRANWDNYAAWKAAGGTPPPPPDPA